MRHDLKNHADKPFDTTGFLCVNEIGLATGDIYKMNKQLEAFFGTRLWKDDQERFAANGSQEGLSLLPNYLVKEIWFPSDVAIQPNPLEGIIENGGRHYHFQFTNEELKTFEKTQYK